MDEDILLDSNSGATIAYNPPRSWWSRVREKAHIEITGYVGECAAEDVVMEDWDEQEDV